MSNIQRPDQHLATYVTEKMLNPDSQFVVRAFQREVVDAVDAIVELAHGEREFVTTENDWKVFEELLKFWAKKWPDEYMEFKSVVSDIRATRNSGGYSQSKEIKYVGALPSQRFMKMVKVIFPAQQWDKKFTNKFVKKFPLFKVGGV